MKKNVRFTAQQIIDVMLAKQGYRPAQVKPAAVPKKRA